MKVRKIEAYKAKDKTQRWKISFEGDETPLIMAAEPTFSTGEDVPDNTLKKVNMDTYSYYILASDTKRTFKKYGRTPGETASIELQGVWKGLVEIFVSGKMEEFETSQSPFVKGMHRYAERRLVQDHPIVEEAMRE